MDIDGAGIEGLGIAIPLQVILQPLLPIAGAEQCEGKSGAPWRVGRQWPRGGRFDLPSCFRRT